MRLGQSNQASKSVAPKVQKEETKLKITFWKNGFTVGDSPLRSYSDPANAAFLESVKNGFTIHAVNTYSIAKCQES